MKKKIFKKRINYWIFGDGRLKILHVFGDSNYVLTKTDKRDTQQETTKK